MCIVRSLPSQAAKYIVVLCNKLVFQIFENNPIHHNYKNTFLSKLPTSVLDLLPDVLPIDNVESLGLCVPMSTLVQIVKILWESLGFTEKPWESSDQLYPVQIKLNFITNVFRW